jgi:hypothetical protein
MQFLLSRKIDIFLALDRKPRRSRLDKMAGITTLLRQRRNERLDVFFMVNERNFQYNDTCCW